MIPTLAYGIGFIVYMTFCLVTIDIYSRKDGMTPSLIVALIYLYYSFLAMYMINLVESGDFIEVIIQCAIYVVAGGVIVLHYYKANIKTRDDEMYGNRI